MCDRLSVRYSTEPVSVTIRPPLPGDIERGAMWEVCSGAFMLAMTWAEVCALIRTLEDGGWVVRPTPETQAHAYPAYVCTHPPVAYTEPTTTDDATRERAADVIDDEAAEA